jgi:transposase InsO family protein
MRGNAYAERWVSSARSECLDWLLIRSERHLVRVIAEYIEHYNHARPHRSRDLRPPCSSAAGPPPPAAAKRIRRRDRLGGLIHEYELAAA